MNVVPEPMLAHEPEGDTRVRTLFLSDLHLGTKGCQAEKLLEFLRDHEADVIYLVGDIVDGWMLRSGWYWPRPTTMSYRNCCAGRARAPASSTSPATTTSSCEN